VDGVERKAGAGLTAIALDLKPTIPAIETLRDCWGRLRGPAKAFHPQ
jgi:hypothetical protein